MAVDTVYATIGRKPALLPQVLETAISGTDEASPAQQRDTSLRPPKIKGRNDMTESQSTTNDIVAVCAAGQGRATWAMGSLFERLVTAEQTGGALGVALVTQPPGLATPTHVHTREAEAWLVLEGTLTYRAGDELFDLAAGDFIYLPRDIPHAFRITGRKPARYVALSIPGRLLDLYDEVGAPAQERRLPDGGIAPQDIARWNELGPTYGLRVVGPPIPELERA